MSGFMSPSADTQFYTGILVERLVDILMLWELDNCGL
jgi:hypothetical protein